MTNEEKYQKLVEFTKKYGEYEDYLGHKNYDIDDIFYSLRLWITCSNELQAVYQKPTFIGTDDMLVTPDNMDEFIQLAKDQMNIVKEFIELIEEIDE